ncbi:hypothetical protein F2Q69_00008933 [Brassica cretica]|uniref:Uncharacterized protein n=1 Tax=Brassica cretica TaxID=69181 RepID=A0A8S9P200_BRACR|nr:hypothetical protein F2Q69_00008933 [Brassica cretica]
MISGSGGGLKLLSSKTRRLRSFQIDQTTHGKINFETSVGSRKTAERSRVVIVLKVSVTAR